MGYMGCRSYISYISYMSYMSCMGYISCMEGAKDGVGCEGGCA